MNKSNVLFKSKHKNFIKEKHNLKVHILSEEVADTAYSYMTIMNLHGKLVLVYQEYLAAYDYILKSNHFSEYIDMLCLNNNKLDEAVASFVKQVAYVQPSE